jgi:hypothetical protein
VGEGPVGLRSLGRLRLFRYEIRRWLGGNIPDAADPGTAIVHVSDDDAVAGEIIDRLPSVPTAVWRRDELATGDMWNSNSVIAWSLAMAGIDVEAIPLPANGRAPGWRAGLVVARRSLVAAKTAVAAFVGDR